MKIETKDLSLNWGDVAYIQEAVEAFKKIIRNDPMTGSKELDQIDHYDEALEHLEETMEAIVPFSSTLVPVD